MYKTVNFCSVPWRAQILILLLITAFRINLERCACPNSKWTQPRKESKGYCAVMQSRRILHQAQLIGKMTATATVVLPGTTEEQSCPHYVRKLRGQRRNRGVPMVVSHKLLRWNGRPLHKLDQQRQ